MTFDECLHTKVRPDVRVMIYTSSNGCTELTIVYKNSECALKYSSNELLESMVDECWSHLNPYTKGLECWVTICHPLERNKKEE